MKIETKYHPPSEEPYPFEAHIVVSGTPTWPAGIALQNRIRAWLEKNRVDAQMHSWRVYFRNEEDLTWFVLRWS